MKKQHTNYPLISVIVPVYNVANYIENSVTSVLNQTHKNLEIILIDDGSTDESGEICEKIANTDSRVIVFHKENSGPSAARNFGMTQISGEYVTFFDPDDQIGIYHIENLYTALISTNSELSITGKTNISINDSPDLLSSKPATTRTITNDEAFAIAIGSAPGTFQEQVWGKLYSKSLFPFLHFPVGKFYEDRFVTYKVIFNAKKIAYEDACDYYYLSSRPESTINTLDNRKFSSLEASYEILEYTRKNHPEAAWAAERCWYTELVAIYTLATMLGEKEVADQIYSTIRKERKSALTNQRTTPLAKLAFLTSFLGRNIFTKIQVLYQKRVI